MVRETRGRTRYVKEQVHVLDVEAVESTTPSPESLLADLQQRLASPTYHPPLLPAAAIRLAQLARQKDVEYRAIREVLEEAPILTAAVLRLAQSSYYRRAEPLRTIEQAMTRLGIRTIADLFLQVSTTTRIFRAAGYDAPMRLLREHSIATAHLARVVCRYTPAFEEYAFLCGLLHDVGAGAGILALADSLREKPRPATSDEVVSTVFLVHERCSEMLARAWDLPGDVVLVLGHHHDLTIGGVVHPYAATICIADALANDLGFGSGEDVDAAQVERARMALDIGELAYVELTREAAAAMKRLSDVSE
jgi:HD-like signal output (HDOD) protein